MKIKGRTDNEKSNSKTPFFFCKAALELNAVSGQILIVLDIILVLAKEECEKDKKYDYKYSTKEARTFQIH